MVSLKSNLPYKVGFTNSATGETVYIYSKYQKQYPESTPGITVVSDDDYAFLKTQPMFVSLVNKGNIVVL